MVAKTAAVAGLLVALFVYVQLSANAQLFMGGALINAGYRFQDMYREAHDQTPQEIWDELDAHNELAAKVRGHLPRPQLHPVVAMLVCMDARIDTSELAGDARRNYYVVRTAGSVMSPEEEDMLELAVTKGVKVIVITRHTDCAAERVAADPVERQRFPALAAAVAERDARLREFLARPQIAGRIARGELLVKQQLIETETDHLTDAQASFAASAGL